MTTCSIDNPYSPTASADPTQPDPEELMSRDEIEALQVERLKWTLHNAYENVPAYRELYDEHGVHPSQFQELSDLSKFPYTDKEFLRNAYPFKSFAVPMSEIRRVHASSGTTGLPTVVGYTQDDLDTWASLVARCFRFSGVEPGQKIHNAYGYGLFTGGLGAHYGGEKLGCAVIPMSGGQTDKQVQLIRDFEPDAILATPTYLLAIADGFRKAGVDPRDTSLKRAVLGAEPWTDEIRREIERTFDITACDIYGLSEVMGPGVAGESAVTRDGSHIWEDHFRPEIIDPFDDRVCDLGEPGELVFTSLTKQALPIIRYRTHDLTRLLPGTDRPGHRRMGRITGRSDDMIIFRGVNIYPGQIADVLNLYPDVGGEYHIELTRSEGLDYMRLRVERQSGVGSGNDAGIARAIGDEMHKRIMARISVEIVDPGALPRTFSKAKRITDLRLSD